MIRGYINIIISLFKDIYFYIVVIVSLAITFILPQDEIVLDGLRLLPSIIGVVFGGTLTSVAIIFGILKDENLSELFKKHGESIFVSISRLRDHLLVILLCLFIILALFFFEPLLLEKILSNIRVSIFKFYGFIGVICSILTFCLTVEVVIILFLIFEIKFELVKRNYHGDK